MSQKLYPWLTGTKHLFPADSLHCFNHLALSFLAASKSDKTYIATIYILDVHFQGLKTMKSC